jgi:hypothetical protein
MPERRRSLDVGGFHFIAPSAAAAHSARAPKRAYSVPQEEKCALR